MFYDTISQNECGIKISIVKADNLISSEYENVYSSRFVGLRDKKILEYYLDWIKKETK